MTQSGGPANLGVLFSIAGSGSGFTIVHAFAGGASDGASPTSNVLYDSPWIYGITPLGGASNAGLLFRVRDDGQFFVPLHSFTGGAEDGLNPYGGLVGPSGTFYGMAYAGGTSNLGIVFSWSTLTGLFTVLHSFSGGAADGSHPKGSLVRVVGTLYGMTSQGGTYDKGTGFRVGTDGSAHQVLHAFGGAGDGASPTGSLVATNTSGLITLYGLTQAGGGERQHDPRHLLEPRQAQRYELQRWERVHADGYVPVGGVHGLEPRGVRAPGRLPRGWVRPGERCLPVRAGTGRDAVYGRDVRGRRLRGNGRRRCRRCRWRGGNGRIGRRGGRRGSSRCRRHGRFGWHRWHRGGRLSRRERERRCRRIGWQWRKWCRGRRSGWRRSGRARRSRRWLGRHGWSRERRGVGQRRQYSELPLRLPGSPNKRWADTRSMVGWSSGRTRLGPATQRSLRALSGRAGIVHSRDRNPIGSAESR